MDSPLPSPPSSPSPSSSPNSVRSNESVSASTSTSLTLCRKNLRKLQPVWRSPVWEFFVVAEDTKFAQCKKCTKFIARGGETTKSFNTSNLVYHLKTKHLEDFRRFLTLKETKESERKTLKKERSEKKSVGGLRQLTLQRREDLTTPWNINDARAIAIHKKLGEMIALDGQPISVVEDIGFINLVRSLEPRYKIPSRKYLTDNLFPRIITGVKAELNKKLHTPELDVKHYSFTTDIWSTNVAHRSLLSLTAHWLSDNFEKSSAVLHVTALEESHTGSYLCTKFDDMLSTWKISKENVHIVLRDNAANMVRTMKDANLSSYGCFAHSLQLVGNDGVLSQRMVTDLLATCRSIVGHFQRSTVAYDKLKQFQQQLEVPQHTLKRDEPTRWNSSLYMLQSIVEQKTCLAAYGSEGSIPVLTATQLDIANKVINVLLPVEEITKYISEDTACISVIIPLVRGLEKTLERSDEDRGLCTMKSEM